MTTFKGIRFKRVLPPEIRTLIQPVINLGIKSHIDKDQAYNLLRNCDLWHQPYLHQINDHDLILFFKGLVIIEKILFADQNHGVSVTLVTSSYAEIRNRGLDKIYQLADFAVKNSPMRYTPFGTDRGGITNAYEFVRRELELEYRINKEKLKKIEKKNQQLQRANEINLQKKLKDLKNKQAYSQILDLTPEEQVKIITSDKAHNILYYVPVIKTLLNEDNISFEIFEPILDKLRQLNPTPFNRRLIKEFSNKIKK